MTLETGKAVMSCRCDVGAGFCCFLALDDISHTHVDHKSPLLYLWSKMRGKMAWATTLTFCAG